MAKGRQKGVACLKDSVPDSEIVRLGEVRNIPNYPFPDGNYGISGGYGDYSLVKKRIAYRTGTVEDGENLSKVIEYEIYEDIPCYLSTFEGVFDAYAKILNLTEFKKKKMKGEISELIEIHKNIQAIVKQALSGIDTYLTDEQKDLCSMADTKLKLQEKIDNLKSDLEKYKKIDKEIDNMYNTIKEKTTIIVNRDKPKNHRTKKEEE